MARQFRASIPRRDALALLDPERRARLAAAMNDPSHQAFDDMTTADLMRAVVYGLIEAGDHREAGKLMSDLARFEIAMAQQGRRDAGGKHG